MEDRSFKCVSNLLLNNKWYLSLAAWQLRREGGGSEPLDLVTCYCRRLDAVVISSVRPSYIVIVVVVVVVVGGVGGVGGGGGGGGGE